MTREEGVQKSEKIADVMCTCPPVCLSPHILHYVDCGTGRPNLRSALAVPPEIGVTFLSSPLSLTKSSLSPEGQSVKARFYVSWNLDLINDVTLSIAATSSLLSVRKKRICSPHRTLGKSACSRLVRRQLGPYPRISLILGTIHI